MNQVFRQIKIAEGANKVALATCCAAYGGRAEEPEFLPECRSAGLFMALSLRRELEINDHKPFLNHLHVFPPLFNYFQLN